MDEESLATIHDRPQVVEPWLVVGMEGWIDAGFGAVTAMNALMASMPTDLVATFDADRLLDQRARRPSVKIVDGVITEMTWPQIQLRHGRHDERDLLLLTGPEPDMRWHRFVDEVVELARDFEVRLAVGVGAFPAPVPHTRPVRLVSSATSRDLADAVGWMGGAIEVPAGIQAALEVAFGQAGIPAIGIWARVPHYVTAMPYPAASAALLQGLAVLGGPVFSVRELEAAAEVTSQRIDELIANSEEHRAMVAQLEAQHDAEHTPPADLSNLPSGDEIAAELERFLRGEGGSA
jgi:proteasome assembly chaperone (PAC2) family protein